MPRFLHRLAHLFLWWLVAGLLAVAPRSDAASMRAAPDPGPEQSLVAPPYPDGWVVQKGIHAIVGGDPADLPSIRHVSTYIESALPRIADELGLPTGRRIHVYVSHTDNQFKELQPGPPPRWADATAWPGMGLVYVRASRLRAGTAEPLVQVLDHELVHLVVGQAFGRRPVPRWLHEGLAQFYSKEYDSDMIHRLGLGMWGQGLISLDSLTSSFPADTIRAQLAYAESADFIAYLHNQYGPEAISGIIRDMVAGRSVRYAFRNATGLSLEDLDRAWRGRLASSHLEWASLVNSNLWWGLGAAIIVVGGMLRWRRNRRRRELWMLQEEAEDRLRRAAGLTAPDVGYSDMDPWQKRPAPPPPLPRFPEGTTSGGWVH